MSSTPKSREIFFELIRLDTNLRVCAVDADTGIEVVTVLPSNTPMSAAKKIVQKKLLWRLEQEQQQEQEAESEHEANAPTGKYI